VGYKRYVDYLTDLVAGKEVFSTGMREEKERCRLAIDRARAGAVVSLISSGDPGIYGMAGLVLEMISSDPSPIPVKIIPGVSAAQIAAARLGAPLTLDYACISLSDLLVPWKTIRHRLECVAAADLVTALYNPRSMRRISQLEEAVAIFRKHRSDTTPAGIATALGADDEKVTLTDLGHLLEQEIDMRTIVLIGNSTSRNMNGWFVTPRGYQL
jgi:precorrin-3B C17-methyltransferase